jgi:hypothetical protein
MLQLQLKKLSGDERFVNDGWLAALLMMDVHATDHLEFIQARRHMQSRTRRKQFVDCASEVLLD